MTSIDLDEERRAFLRICSRGVSCFRCGRHGTRGFLRTFGMPYAVVCRNKAACEGRQAKRRAEVTRAKGV